MGKTHIKSTRQKNKRTAELMEAKMKSDLVQQHQLGMLEEITLEEASKNYLVSKEHLGSHTGIKNHMVLCKGCLNPKAKVSTITNKHVLQMVLELQSRFKPATCKTVLRSFFSMISFTGDQGYNTPKLKPHVIKIPKKKTTFITKKQEAALLERLDPSNRTGSGTGKRGGDDNYDLTVVLFDTGCRINEAYKLEWSRIDMNKRTIRIWRSKVGNETTINMTDRVYKILQKRKMTSTHDLVFVGRDGQLREHPPVAIRCALDDTGLQDFTIHDFRKAFASRLAVAGISIQKIAHMLGHSNTQTTEIYAHLLPDDVSRETNDVINALNNGV